MAKPTLILGETIPDSPQTASLADPPAVEAPAVQLPETPKPETPPPDIPKVPVPLVESTPGVEKSGGECAVRRRVNKMDEVELASGLQKAREHPSFQHYLKAWGITADKFGVNMIDDMVAFTYFIEQTDSQPEGSTAQSPPEEPSPSAPSPQASEQPSNPTPPPAANQQHISEALTRLQTVDLDKGLRPPQSCVADPTVCHTVVLLSLAGKLQPVSVPMTPEQCVAAGLTLANPPHKDVKNHSEGTQLVALGSVGKDQEKNETKETVEEKTEPKETDVKKDETDQELEDPTSKQMLKNLYMRYSRSVNRKDLPPEVASRLAALKEKEKQLGKLSPAVRKERQQLFEEFVQAGENWAESSIVLNSKNEHKEKQRGVYKLMSRADLLVKYHGDESVVSALVKSKEELQDFEVNPDVPTMRLYRCWDSKALISEDSQSRSITTEQRGEVTADQAAILMHNPGAISPSFAPDGSGGANSTEGDDKNKNRKGGKGGERTTKGKDKGEGKGKTPKAKTPAQEAKAAMSQASGLILEGEGWNQKLLAVGVPEQLRTAVNNDLGKTISCLKSARSGVEASVAGGCSDDDLRVKTQELAKAIADYKQGSKSANSLYSQHKPKQPKSTPKAKAAPLAIENQQ